MVLRADVLAAALDAAVAPDDPRPRLLMSPRGAPLDAGAGARARERARARSSSAAASRGSTSASSRRAASRRSRSATTCSPAARSPRWRSSTPACGCSRASWARTLPGAEESFEAGLLEYPHYTRPREWEGRAIPEVLLSGDHAAIAALAPRRGRADHAGAAAGPRRRRGGDHHGVLKRAPTAAFRVDKLRALLYGAPQLTTGCRNPRAAVAGHARAPRQEH